MLTLDNVSKQFGGLRAVSHISLEIDRTAITALIGPNGAGKTTLFSLVAGTLHPTRGRIMFRGRDITGLSPSRICQMGIARTFQVVKPFWDLSVRDHLRAAALFAGHHRPSDDEIDGMLELTALVGRADEPAHTLTLAGCKRLEIARALATGARLVLLDETMAGLSPEETRAALDLVRSIVASGRTVVLIEHVLAAVTDLCDRAIVLDHGEVIADGTPRAVLADGVVKKAYLGE